MPKKRGKPSKSWFQKLRIFLWYRSVIDGTGLNNQELDAKFAWKNDEAIEFRSSADRPRIFENIGKKLQEPLGKDSSFRNMPELVSAVGLEPNLAGTRAIYDSILWDILDQKAISPEFIEEQINVILERYCLERRPLDEVVDSPESYRAIQKKYDASHIYLTFLDGSILTMEMDTLTSISLMWLLFLQNEPSYNYQIRSALQGRLDQVLDKFFYKLDDTGIFDFYLQAIPTLLASKVDLSRCQIYPERFEEEGSWLIVPTALIGKIGDDFFPIPQESSKMG